MFPSAGNLAAMHVPPPNLDLQTVPLMFFTRKIEKSLSTYRFIDDLNLRE
jgi:hypothetical protein